MTTNAENYQESLNQICAETIGQLASEIDRSGAFPERSIEALKGASLMGAISAPEVGGLGLGPRGAAEIVRRVAQETADRPRLSRFNCTPISAR